MNLSRNVFNETFTRFKVAVVIQQIYFRYVKARHSTSAFAISINVYSISRVERLSWPNALGFELPRHQERQESKAKETNKFFSAVR